MRWRTVYVALLAWVAVAILTGGTAHAQMHTSTPGVKLIERFEGYEPTPAPDPVGIPTVCFGQTAVDGPLPAHATFAQCERLLRRSLARGYEPSVRALFAHHGRLYGLFNQHRFDALVSVVYNLGTGVLQAIVYTRNLRAVAARLLLYDHAGGHVLLGLSIRRHAEAGLLLQQMGRFELYPRLEVHLIVSFDRLRGHRSAAARRRRCALRRAMRTEARRIAVVARREPDWLSTRRLDRYRALSRRTQTGGTTCPPTV
jgi:lysozyme